MELRKKITAFPGHSGVYWMKDRHGAVLYVGKAKDLRKRVRAYFGREEKTRYQVKFLMSRTVDIEYLVTDTEKEALLLENTLIKKHRPRYNIFFRDDKSYASLRLNIGHDFPGLFVTRRIVKDGSLYYGPYASAGALRRTVDLVTKHFRLRTCSDHEFANRSRPCLEYHIGRCSAPCVGMVSREAYDSQVREARLFFEGRKKELLKILKGRMEEASLARQYEEAAKNRDLIFYIRETLEKQKVVHHAGRDFDVVGCHSTDHQTLFCVFFIRGGSLIDRKRFVFQRTVPVASEFLSHFVLQYYGTVLEIPKLIFVPSAPDDRGAIEEILKERSGLAVRLQTPVRGEMARLVAMATENAKEMTREKIQREEKMEERLQKKLGLIQPPRRIECVDISNLQGKEAVGSLVFFEEGSPVKNRYRKFKIRFTEESPNDTAMMYEVLHRRFRRVLKAKTPDEAEKWSPPDLLLVDGGKGQLNVALRALADLGLHGQGTGAIAKARGEEKSDKIYIPGRKNPVSFRPNDPALLYLMRIRDEAHRFGVAYHRTRRKKSAGLSG